MNTGERWIESGRLRFLFQPEEGWIRYIQIDGVEVLRAIYVSVRDASWKTIVPKLRSFEVREDRIAIECVCAGDDIAFTWRGDIEFREGHLEYRLEGQAAADFQTNRTGFCVLHPLGFAGQEVAVEHSDGTVESGSFPYDISPHQPFTNIQALEIRANDTPVRISLEGEAFEMEDQRNWSDASFKTYCHPQSGPMPYTIHAGVPVVQSVRLSYPAGNARTPVARAPWVEVVPDYACPRPKIGTLVRTARDVAFAASLGLDHVRYDLDLGQDGSLASFETILASLGSLELELGLRIGEASDASLAELPALLKRAEVNPARCLVLDESGGVTVLEALTRARRCLACPILGGSTHNFTEVNRHYEWAESADGIFFASNPQVHAFDDRTIFENLEGLEHCVRNAQRLAFGRSVCVSSLRLARDRDPRVGSPLARVWALGAVRAAAMGGATSLTLLSADELRGNPVSEAIKALAEHPAQQVLESRASFGFDVQALALENTVFVLNYRPDPARVEVRGVGDVDLPAHGIVRMTLPDGLTRSS